MQHKNKIKSSFSDFLEGNSFYYEFTDENYMSKTEYYRSRNLRYMICYTLIPLDEESPNIFIFDAKSESYNATVPHTGSTIFKGIINNVNDLKTIFKILGVK